jgi:hypothetical protein
MRFGLRNAVLFVMLPLAIPGSAGAQDTGYFVGALAGVATLSGDPSAIVTADGFAVSKYKPENGLAVNLFVGAHLRQYVTVQASYMWNRNDLGLFAGVASDNGNRFYDQPRTSAQHAVVGDVLVYFRERASRIRPYLSGGLGIVRFQTDADGTPVDGGLPLPPARVTSTDVTLRVAVGVDVPIDDGWNVRYSFSESIGPNPISRELDPPGSRSLMNFQNLVGVMRAF